MFSTDTLGVSLWHSGMSPNQYEIIVLPAAVKKCYGCGNAFVSKFRKSPHNLIVKHLDWRISGKSPQGNLTYSADFCNTYYHPSRAHVQRKNPIFTGLVYISAELYSSLNKAECSVVDSFDLNVIRNI